MTQPKRLLDAFGDHLTENGGIQQKSIPHLIELMQSTKGKLVPKCISLCIIAASSSEVQSVLCDGGVWEIMLKWLQEALKEDNCAFLLELLNVYSCLPVRLEHLTQNVCPKLINSLTKRCDNEDVKAIAFEIVKKWKAVISADSKRVDKRTDVTQEQPSVNKKLKLVTEIKPNDTPVVENFMRDEKKRKRTAKIPPTVMRTAGIEDLSCFQPRSRSEVIAKKSKPDAELKLSPELPIESFHQRITVAPTEQKKMEIHESLDFINALTTTPQPIVRKKRKFPVKVESPPDGLLKKSTVVDDCDAQMKDSNMFCSESFDQSSTAVAIPFRGMGGKKSSLTSLSSSFSVETKPKKRVSWADEDNLQSFFYFELDESERVNVNLTVTTGLVLFSANCLVFLILTKFLFYIVNVNRASPEDIRRKELSMERQLFRRGTDDATISLQKWYTPPALERIFLVELGHKSIERQVQAERERYVLQAIYFSRETIPDSAEEPDPETRIQIKPVDIPLEDLAVIDSHSDNKSTDDSQVTSEKLLMVQNSGDAQMSLNPEVANLVKSLAANLSGTQKEPVQTSVVTTSNVSDSLLPSPPVPLSSSPSPSRISTASASNADLPIHNNQLLQRELWDVLEENYPDLNLHELSAERIRDLLEPLKDQLVNRGIFHLPPPGVFPLPPRTSQMQHPPPHPNLAYNPHSMNRPPYPGLPPRLSLPPPSSDFHHPHINARSCSSMSGGFRPPSPRFPPNNHPTPSYHRNPGPVRGGSSHNRGGPYSRGRSSQPCKFFQQGQCRNGSNCTFLH